MKQESYTYITVLIGVTVWVLFGLIPLAGAFVLLAYFVVTLGALSLTLYERLRA